MIKIPRFNPANILNELTRDDMISLYQKHGTFDACAIVVNSNRNSWRKRWYEMDLPDPSSIKKEPKRDPDEVHEFLACGDMHIGSNHQQITAFLDFCQMGIENGITTMVIPGDIVEGLHKRDGSVQCRFLHTIDTIYDYTCNVFSKFADMYENIFIINGNHCETLNKRDDGFDLCRHLSEDFPSVKYAGSPSGMVKPVVLPGGAKAILFHGDGSCTCNLSARTRSKTIDFINMGLDFDFLVCGHCHRSSFDFWLQTYGISVGAFQSVTEFLARKGKQPQVQGQRIQYQVNSKNRIHNVVNIPYNYDDQIKLNDWSIP